MADLAFENSSDFQSPAAPVPHTLGLAHWRPLTILEEGKGDSKGTGITKASPGYTLL